VAPEFEGTPRKHSEFAGRKNVLETHPVNRQVGSALERVVALPAGRKTALSVAVAAHERGDWQLRVLADGAVVHQRIVGGKGERWQSVLVDLSRFAGKTIRLRLENCANDWSFEFGYWSELELKIAEQTASVR
jgi:hypothetical protein